MKKIMAGIILMALLTLARLPLQAAKAPPPITRDGLFKSIEIGGLTEEDLIGLINEYGVDFQCAIPDERRLTASRISAKVIEALRANYRAPSAKQGPTQSEAETGATSEAGEITAGPPSPEPQTEEIVAGGPKPAAITVALAEEETVAGGPKPAAVTVALAEEETVAGGPKPAVNPVPQDLPAPPAAEVVAPPATALPLQIAAAAPVPPEFIPAAPQRKVFPSVPAGLAPFVKGPHVVKIRVQIDERGAVQAAQVISMTGEQNATVARIATQSAQQWHFTPAQAAGKAVASEQILRFVL